MRPTVATPPLTFEPAPYDATPVEFTSLGLDKRLEQAVVDRGFVNTTPIQSAVYPGVFDGVDLVACAQTGTGKTLAFLLPIMQKLLSGDGRKASAAQPPTTRVLILAPTRELAVQIEDEFQGLAYHTNLSSVAVYGGVDASPQERGLRGAADIVVATPGRLIDHMGSKSANFDGLEVLVLDEADRMLDMGFWPSVRRIVASLPANRQTLLFSATMSEEVAHSVQQIMRNPKIIRVGRVEGLASTIHHVSHLVPSTQKAAWLKGFLQRTDGTSLVFVRTKRGADKLARRLGADGIRCAALHADRTQSQRSAAMEGFKSGRYTTLIATDIAARGIDIDNIAHVVNYEVPGSVDTYVHRVGRTGRAETAGTALTLVAPEELPALRVIEKSLQVSFSDGGVDVDRN
ncbi:MAG TPA: DEAD/DEAH box helicase [Vicinamibacterales bacterium]|jgi:ATP-dependent RNA helicase RhlE|nr:DEAD/DEAH box helicase [Vicinamibacterales bacterium]